MLTDLMQPWTRAASAWDILAVGAGGDSLGWRARRDRRLHELLDAAAARSPLYAGGAAAVPGVGALDRLARWPVVQRRELMQRFDDWLTDRSIRRDALQRFVADPSRIGQLFEGRAMVWTSSGSSGEPGLFVHDQAALGVYDLLESLRRPVQWPGFGPLAFVGATGGHYASVCTIERLRRSNPWFAATMRSFSFTQPLAQLAGQLQRYAPSVLATYPSIALLLAEEAAAGRLHLRLAAVWTGGETLTPAVRRFVEASFGAPVIDSYGASEFIALGCQCTRGALHLNSDWAILEPVDEQMRPVEPGRFGRTTLLTNLANHLQPLIRYDLGDRVRIEPQGCACGSPLPVIEVEGRCDDTLTLHDDAGRAVRLPPLALVGVLEDEAELFDFQLVQCGERALRLDLCRRDETAHHQLRRAHDALGAYLRNLGLGRVRLSGRCGVEFGHGASGKVQRIVALGGAALATPRRRRAAADAVPQA